MRILLFFSRTWMDRAQAFLRDARVRVHGDGSLCVAPQVAALPPEDLRARIEAQRALLPENPESPLD